MFADILKCLRLENKMTQAELANVLKTSPSTIGMYEQNRRTPDLETLKNISKFFNVSIDFLMGTTEYRNTPSLNKINNKLKDSGLETIAAHFEGEEFTEDDLEDIENFISYIISKKKQK